VGSDVSDSIEFDEVTLRDTISKHSDGITQMGRPVFARQKQCRTVDCGIAWKGIRFDGFVLSNDGFDKIEVDAVGPEWEFFGRGNTAAFLE